MRRLTLRSRLLLSVGALLAVALVVSGGLIVGLTRAGLVQQVDGQLRSVAQDLGRPGPGIGRLNDPTGRRFALILFDDAGNLVQSLASGFQRDPDPLPALPGSEENPLPLGTIVERPAVDGLLAYRLLRLQVRERGAIIGSIVLGAPLRDVEEAMGALVRTLVLVGGVALAAMQVVGWLVIRRDLRPLERVTATAEAISGGNLTQRVGLPRDATEVGRLGAAFDSMLDQIQHAFDSQQRALEAQAQSEERLRQFVADASHELRTPLTALRGYSDLYHAGGLSDGDELDQAMTRIRTESRRMAGLVEDLLLLARLDEGRPLRSESVDLSEIVGDAITDARAVEPARPLTSELESGLVVTGDEDHLRQAIGNLLANVRVHTPVESPVEITLAGKGGRCLLRVADHGPGVAPGQAEHIFDRFYRGDAGRSRDRGGSGLGLAISASIAAAHGGAIEYAATAGGGATFTLSLPQA